MGVSVQRIVINSQVNKQLGGFGREAARRVADPFSRIEVAFAFGRKQLEFGVPVLCGLCKRCVLDVLRPMGWPSASATRRG